MKRVFKTFSPSTMHCSQPWKKKIKNEWWCKSHWISPLRGTLKAQVLLRKTCKEWRRSSPAVLKVECSCAPNYPGKSDWPWDCNENLSDRLDTVVWVSPWTWNPFKIPFPAPLVQGCLIPPADMCKTFTCLEGKYSLRGAVIRLGAN